MSSDANKPLRIRVVMLNVVILDVVAPREIERERERERERKKIF